MMSNAWLSGLVVLAFLSTSLPSVAIPPEGLTFLDDLADDAELRLSKLSVVAGVAYASTPTGIYGIDASGAVERIEVANPFQGSGEEVQALRYSRVGQAIDGGPQFAAYFPPPFVHTQVALYSLSDISEPRQTWTLLTNRLDSHLASDIRFITPTLEGEVIARSGVFHVDGTRTPIDYPGELGSMFFAVDALPTGTVLVNYNPAGTLGIAAALVELDGSYQSLPQFSSGGYTLRERPEGGVNVGGEACNSTTCGPAFRYANGEFYLPETDPRFRMSNVLASESDFAVLAGFSLRDSYVFYPGVDPTDQKHSAPFLELFPDLHTIDESEKLRVLDVTSVNGQIHMLLDSADNRIWLYAAPDPSLIPEPATALLVFVALLLSHFATRTDRSAVQNFPQ